MKRRWIQDEYGDYHCEVCKAIIEKDEWTRHNYYYCYHCGSSMIVGEEDTNLTKEEFIDEYCTFCGSQRCEGIDSIWFEGCKYKGVLKNET